MRKVKFNRFYRYDELTRLLKAYAKEYPNLIRLESIGKSHEGRDVWLVTVTNFRLGEDAEKPAFWVDANIHASEVTASAAALYLVNALVRRYKKDESVKRALHTRAFYIVPRVNPDGAEWALADKPIAVSIDRHVRIHNQTPPPPPLAAVPRAVAGCLPPQCAVLRAARRGGPAGAAGRHPGLPRREELRGLRRAGADR